ncbi:unnamed protein product [Citrullus colocynthis]|uniref:Uncharacterized protein n=1 Tax=Citrullus colocynthis TaxID=252529 RepID=A0ABP0XUN2_9ROSI
MLITVELWSNWPSLLLYVSAPNTNCPPFGSVHDFFQFHCSSNSSSDPQSALAGPNRSPVLQSKLRIFILRFKIVPQTDWPVY